MQNKLLKIHPKDNVAVALVNLIAGDQIALNGENIAIILNTKAKHKIALQHFDVGDSVYMYGVLVGKAVVGIQKGALLSTQNVVHKSAKISQKEAQQAWISPDVRKWEGRTFLGYHREDGQVGTDNVWLFFPLVFCENRNIEILKKIFEEELEPKAIDKHQLLLRSIINKKQLDLETIQSPNTKPVFGNIKMKFITHQGGCGAIRQDAESLAKLLAGYVNNPNVAGATVLSLGCQNLQIEMFQKALQKINPCLKKPILIYEQQKLGTVDQMLEKIITESFAEIKKGNNIKRQPAPLSKLKIGLECGGSDGFSGISANPLLGQISDILVTLDGTVVLSEFPELCGVEQELINRCTTIANAEKFISLMHDYEASAINAGSSFDMNPSPGNIKDGLITDAMKSAGAAKKGGTSPITDVLDYGEYISKAGLNLLCTPGNDVESTTAMVGSGANLVLFTTGLGTPTGNPIAPVMKISSNTNLAKSMPDIIDFDAGDIIKGHSSIEAMAEQLLDLIIAVANGETKTKETLLGQDDFIPWSRGISL